MSTRRKHSVKANFQIFDLSKAGTSLELEVFTQHTRRKRRKIATLIIGRGSLTWKQGKGKRGRRFTWPRLAEILRQS